MTITITYGDLKTQVLNLIKSRCRNIDTNTNLSAALKSGYSRTVTKLTGTPQAKCVITSNDTWGNVVTSATVESQFDSYMTS